jgi:Big-like domain-containing protein/CARDB protein
MRPFARLSLATVLGVLACDAPTPPATVGGLTVRVLVVAGRGAALDSGKILVRGPSNVDVRVSPGARDTIEGLLPGTYTVGLEGFQSDAVSYFGQTTGVHVVAGENTTATVASFASFMPAQPVFSDTFWIGTQVPVSFTAVAGATNYRVEWSQDPTFASGVNSAPIPNTSTQIAVADYLVYYFRVRAVDPYQTVGIAGPATRLHVVKFGPARQLRFSQQPTTTPSGKSIVPAIAVIAQDSLGDTAAAYTGNVTISLAAKPKNGTLSGTSVVAASGGVAMFSNLRVDSAAVGYTLQATALGLHPDTSQQFTVLATQADLLILASPSLTAAPGTVTQGDSITVSGFRVTNAGTGASSGSTSIGYYLSTDSTIDASDIRLGGVTIGPLAPAETTAVSSKVLDVARATPPRSYFLGALVDDSGTTPESNEFNNFQSTAVHVKVVFQVTSVLPANGASNIEAGAVVAAQFSDAVKVQTLNATSFTVNTGGDTLPTRITYDPVSRTASLVAPFLPSSPYQASVTTAVQDTAGRSSDSAFSWMFTTRGWQGVFVGAGGNRPSMGLFGSGVHVVHGGNGFLYSGCFSSCTVDANWRTGTIDAAGGLPSLAIDSQGRLHVTYHDGSLNALRYATCTPSIVDCTVATNWQSAVLDTVGNQGGAVDYASSITVDQNDRLNVVYHGNSQFSTSDLMYATCDSVCTNPSSWQIVPIDQGGDVGHYPAFVIDRTGRRHVSYLLYDFIAGDQGYLKYATCAAGCNTPANWDTVTVDKPGPNAIYSSIAVDSFGRPHVSYWGSGNYGTFDNLIYATCTGACTLATGWQVTVVDHPSGVGSSSSIGIDTQGRLHVSYASGDDNISTLKYATCAISCSSPANWRSSFVDVRTGKIGYLSWLVVDQQGRVHVSYSGLNGLWYVE